jgi:hypothetical protein
MVCGECSPSTRLYWLLGPQLGRLRHVVLAFGPLQLCWECAAKQTIHKCWFLHVSIPSRSMKKLPKEPFRTKQCLGALALTHVSCQRLHSDLTQQQGLRSHLLPWYSPLSGENQTSKFTVSAVVSGVFHASIESWNNNNSPTKIKIL